MFYLFSARHIEYSKTRVQKHCTNFLNHPFPKPIKNESFVIAESGYHYKNLYKYVSNLECYRLKTIQIWTKNCLKLPPFLYLYSIFLNITRMLYEFLTSILCPPSSLQRCRFPEGVKQEDRLNNGGRRNICNLYFVYWVSNITYFQTDEVIMI